MHAHDVVAARIVVRRTAENLVAYFPLVDLARGRSRTTISMTASGSSFQIAAVLPANRPTGVNHHMNWETLTHAGMGRIGLPTKAR
jgi:hypothetical protein